MRIYFSENISPFSDEVHCYGLFGVEILMRAQKYTRKSALFYLDYAGPSQGGGEGLGGSSPPPQFLADQLTLSQPGGAHSPYPVLRALPDCQNLRRPCNVDIQDTRPTSQIRIK